MLHNNLSAASVGTPITRLNVSFFPVYVKSNGLPRIATGPDAGLLVDELPQAAVPTLLAHNPTDRPILVVEGEHFHGGKQNRTVNVDVLMPARTKLQLPVSCLEAGRWGRKEAYRHGQAFADRNVRRAVVQNVAQSVRRTGTRRGDQGAVWAAVDRSLRANVASSATSAAAAVEEVYERKSGWSATVRELCDRGPLRGQCGIAVTHGEWVVAVDVFGAPNLLAAHWNALMRSYLMEEPKVQGAPSAAKVLWFIRRFAEQKSNDIPGVALGIERRVSDEVMVGQALTLDGQTVHASFFSKK